MVSRRAIVLAGLSGVPGLFRPRAGKACERLFVVLMSSASGLACAGDIIALVIDRRTALVAAWPVPGGRFAISVDAIAAMFVIQIALLSMLGPATA